MEQSTITTQPLPSSDHTEILLKPGGFPTEKNDAGYNEGSGNVLKQNPSEADTEVTAVFHSDDINELYEKETDKRRQQREEAPSDCCCAYVPDSDPFFVYLCCHWLMDCFRCIGECTDSCFDNCASCLGNCCEKTGNEDAGCLDWCCSWDGDCHSDCATGCCGSCSCVCTS